MLTSTEHEIITLVYTGDLHTKIDLIDLYKKIIINDTIKSAKYNGMGKGDITSLKSLYNEVAIRVFSEYYDKHINIKVFSNGKIHISGIQNIDQAKEATKIILDILVSVKEKINIKVILIDGIIYDKHDYETHGLTNLKSRENIVKIYSKPNSNGISKRIGFKKGIKYVINDDECFLYEDVFASSKFNNSIKNIYNKNGNILYSYEYIHKFNKKNLIMMGRTFESTSDGNFDIIDKYGNTTGSISVTKNEDNEKITEITEINETMINIECVPDEYLNKFDSIDEILESIAFNISNISRKFDLLHNNRKFTLNKINMHSVLSEKYTGIFKSYLDIHERRLIVKIDDNATYVFFATGKVLLSSKEEDKMITDKMIQNLLVFFNEYESSIISKTKPVEEIAFNEKLTIQDLL
jgi:hypothetical protein